MPCVTGCYLLIQVCQQSVPVDGHLSGSHSVSQSASQSVSELTCQLCRLPVEWVTLDEGSPRRESGESSWSSARMCAVHGEVSQRLRCSCLSTANMQLQQTQSQRRDGDGSCCSCHLLGDTCDQNWMLLQTEIFLLESPSTFWRLVPRIKTKCNL